MKTRYSYITNCYSTGVVNGSSSHIGGFVGWNYRSVSSITNCYFLKENGGMNSDLSGVGSNNGSANVTAQTTTQMKTKSRFSGFNFTTVWGISEGVSFPYLRDIEENITNPPGK
jgi:hypothetical protein